MELSVTGTSVNMSLSGQFTVETSGALLLHGATGVNLHSEQELALVATDAVNVCFWYLHDIRGQHAVWRAGFPCESTEMVHSFFLLCVLCFLWCLCLQMRASESINATANAVRLQSPVVQSEGPMSVGESKIFRAPNSLPNLT